MNGGMKVPIYERQTQLTRDAGARPLSAMASPGAYAAPANAAFGMGKAISGAGDVFGDIAIAEMRQESATMLASEESKCADEIFDEKTDAVAVPIGQSKMVPNPNPSAKLGPRKSNLVPGPAETQQEHLARYRSVLTRRAAAQASRITNRNVRRKFRADAASKIQTAMPAIQTQLRVRYLDRSRAVLDNLTITKRREINQVAFDSPTRQTLINEHINKIREDGRANGEKETEIESRVRKFRSSTIEDYIASEMIAAAETDDLNRIKQLQLQVQGSGIKTSDFYGLLPDISLRLEKRLSDLYEREDRRIVAKSERKERTDKKEAKERQEKIVSEVAQTIADERSQKKPISITSSRIDQLPIKREQKNQLHNMHQGRDVIYNPTYVADVKGEIYEAVEDDEIEDILQTAKNDRDRNIIGIKAYEEIKKEADDALANSPESIERKDNKTFLEGALGLDVNRRTKAPALLARRRQVLRNYNYHLAQGVRPAEAAMITLTEAAKRDEQVMKNIANELPNAFTENVPVENKKLKINAQSIAQMKANWEKQFQKAVGIAVPEDTSSEGIRKLQKANKAFNKKQRLTARALFEIESRINAIERLYFQRQQASNKVEDKSKSAKTREERSMFQKFTDLFSESPSSDTAAPGQSIMNRP